MPRGKKELAEQIIPYAARGRSGGGARQDRCRVGQEDRCDGADVLVKRRSSTVASGSIRPTPAASGTTTASSTRCLESRMKL